MKSLISDSLVTCSEIIDLSEFVSIDSIYEKQKSLYYILVIFFTLFY